MSIPTQDGPDDRLLTTYKQIWSGAEAEGAFVNYYGISARGEAGYFHAREGEGRKPIIAIVRPYYVTDEKPSRRRNNGIDVTDDEMRAEMMTLAHECGHFRSWLRARDAGGAARVEWLAYQDVARRRDAIADRIPRNAEDFYARLREANQRDLSDEDRRRIVNEETAAWRIGREALEQVGYDRLDEYDLRAEAGPQIYRYHLGMVPLEAVPEWARGQATA